MEKVSILINNGLGGFALGEGAEEWLMEQGYDKRQAEAIGDGNCPRDLPILLEAFKKFGGYRKTTIEEKTVDKGSRYYIENYDGDEYLITLDEMSVATGEEPEDWKPKNK